MSTEHFINKYARSAQIVGRYYRRAVSRLADGVLERESELQNPLYGRTEDFFERHAQVLQQVSVVYASLKDCASPEEARFRVKEFDVKGGIERAVNDWLADNPGLVVLQLSFVEEKCFILYREFGCLRSQLQPSCRGRSMSR